MTRDNAVAAKGIATLPSGAQIVHVTATKTLSLFERNVFADDSGNANFTITLPDVAEAAGLFYYIRVDLTNSKTITVDDNGSDAGFSSIGLDADNEYVFLYSTGKEWIQTSADGYT